MNDTTIIFVGSIITSIFFSGVYLYFRIKFEHYDSDDSDI